ncbi:MAG: response regulator [Chitinophagaceae bacterium]|nr:response regulator [Anaerolineae bacterium]
MVKILYVEDDPVNARLVRRMLSDSGYELLETDDGLEGLRIAAEQIPDLILMDVNLPNISGLDITRRLKSDRKLTHIPVIALTANTLIKDREEALKAGCNGYLPKPISRVELNKVIDTFVRRS